jgi:hypothetical protein
MNNRHRGSHLFHARLHRGYNQGTIIFISSSTKRVKNDLCQAVWNDMPAIKMSKLKKLWQHVWMDTGVFSCYPMLYISTKFSVSVWRIIDNYLDGLQLIILVESSTLISIREHFPFYWWMYPLYVHESTWFQHHSTPPHISLVGKPEGRRPLGRPRRRWVNNIKIDLKRDRMEWCGLDRPGSR